MQAPEYAHESAWIFRRLQAHEKIPYTSKKSSSNKKIEVRRESLKFFLVRRGWKKSAQHWCKRLDFRFLMWLQIQLPNTYFIEAAFELFWVSDFLNK